MFSNLAQNSISDNFKFFCLQVSLWKENIPGNDQCTNPWYHYYLNTIIIINLNFMKDIFYIIKVWMTQYNTLSWAIM